MPSKTKKKPSKTPSKLSYSEDSATKPEHNDDDEDDFCVALLEEASIKYPSLISRTAFCGRITETDELKSHRHFSRIYLSKSAMIAASISPNSIVSVSLPAPSKKYLTPFDSFADESAGDVGNHFALAVVSLCSKFLKNEVRLSWNLSCTMGYPAIGRIIFVHPIEGVSISRPLNSTNSEVSHVSLGMCKDIYLKLVRSVNTIAVYRVKQSPNDSAAGNDQSSPKTPSPYRSHLASPSAKLLLRRSQESASPVDDSVGTNSDLSAVIKALEDEKTKEPLQIYARWWLFDHRLLRGNLVTLPICGQLYCFRVEGATMEECPSQDMTYESNMLPHGAQAPNSVNYADAAFQVGLKTKVHLCSSGSSAPETPRKGCLTPVDLQGQDFRAKDVGIISKLGGLSKEFAALKDIIIFSLLKKDTIKARFTMYKGVLLYGPPGTGKTSLAHSCVHDAGVNLFSINGPEIVSQYYGESEQALSRIFDSARQAAPAVVFIDELDAIAPARKDGGEELSKRMLATLLTLMDGISRTDGVLVIAATNRPDSIDSALRRPGRFDREIEIGVPSPNQRLEILITLLSEISHSLVDAQIQSLASMTHGFVGADLAALCNEAALTTLRHYMKLRNSEIFSGRSHKHYKEPSVKLEENRYSSVHVNSVSSLLSNLTLSSEPVYSFNCREKERTPESAVQYVNDNGGRLLDEEVLLKVAFDDFEKAKLKVRPSAMREVMLEVPNVKWEDVGGQNEVKKQLMEAVEWPQKYQKDLERIGICPPTGVLMFGPPGCSKTLMARAVASEAGLNFLAVKGPELFSQWVGESEKAVRSLFSKARAAAPSIIFFDEIDGLAVARGEENSGASVGDRVMSQLLVELDGLKQRGDVIVIAATNRPDKIDPALLRPGRFDRLLYVGPPNEDDRDQIFRVHLRKKPCGSDVSTGELARLTEGYTGADISSICREVTIAAMEESFDITEISMRHFKVAVERVQPSEVSFYQEYSPKFQRLVRGGGSAS